MKDHKHAEDEFGVVYKLKRKGCDSVHVRSATEIRMKEHKDDIRKMKPLSNVYRQCRDFVHTFDSESVLQRVNKTCRLERDIHF